MLEATPDHLMVQDFGKGIPKEDLEMVTEPFYMVDKSRSRAKGSVGLGLSLCQKIIELHDFQLKIESNPEKELPSLFSGNHTNVYISVTNRERFGVMLDDILITTLERRNYQK